MAYYHPTTYPAYHWCYHDNLECCASTRDYPRCLKTMLKTYHGPYHIHNHTYSEIQNFLSLTTHHPSSSIISQNATSLCLWSHIFNGPNHLGGWHHELLRKPTTTAGHAPPSGVHSWASLWPRRSPATAVGNTGARAWTSPSFLFYAVVLVYCSVPIGSSEHADPKWLLAVP